MKKTFQGWFGQFILDPDIDFYGEEFWNRVAEKSFEPDTMVFLENNCDSMTDFIDVGAATGAISFIAAKLGSRVLSFEVIPSIFEVAQAHLDNNPEICERVTLQNKAVSNHVGVLNLGEDADSKVLSDISKKDLSTLSKTSVEIISLIEEIEAFHKKNRKLVIKIDIEGAEWKLLSDLKTLKGLSRHNAKILLAIHPGFDRPYRSVPFGLTFLLKKYWQTQNLIVCYLFFRRVKKFATISRTNLDPVRSPLKCVLLMFGGYFEFIIDFKA